MMWKLGLVALLGCAAVAQRPAGSAPPQTPAAPAAPAPGIVIETEKGTIEIALLPAEAPKSVAHVVDLVRQNFYRGLRFHRVEEGLVQFGDPLTRSMRNVEQWGHGGGENPIGVAEISKTRKHERGTVGLANAGDPKFADSQIYIMKRVSPSLDGKYTIIGHVTKGMEVVDKIAKADVLKTVTLKAAAPK